jgi:hypothetical protein
VDAWSERLRVAKFNGALYFNAECGSPWCVVSPPSKTFAPHVSTADVPHLLRGGVQRSRLGGGQ